MRTRNSFVVYTLVLLVLFLAIAVPVLAYSYSATITLAETTGTGYTMISLIADINNTDLITGGYMLSSGLDTRVMDGSTALPHMISDDKTLFNLAVPADSTMSLDYIMGNAPLTSFYVTVGYDGYVTTADDPAIEMGDEFYLAVVGWIDTIAGADRDMWFKDSACRLRIDAVTDGTVTFAITGGASVTATTITSAYHTIEVIADGTNLRLWIDDTLEDTQPLGGVGVPDNGNDIVLNRDNAIPYGVYRLWIK